MVVIETSVSMKGKNAQEYTSLRMFAMHKRLREVGNTYGKGCSAEDKKDRKERRSNAHKVGVYLIPYHWQPISNWTGVICHTE